MSNDTDILGGITLVKRTREVTIGVSTEGKEVKVNVNPPQLQLVPELRVQIPNPEPPPLLNDAGKPRFETNHRTGKPLKKDGQLIPKLNFLDPDYLVQVASVENARTTAMIFACAEFGGRSNLGMDDYKSPVAYWTARWKELENRGLDVGTFNELATACNELGESMTVSEIEDARALFGADKKTQDEIKEQLGEKAPSGK